MEKQSQKQAVKFALRQMSMTLVKLNTLKGTGIDLTEFTDPLLSCIEDLICTFLSETEDQFENKLELISKQLNGESEHTINTLTEQLFNNEG